MRPTPYPYELHTGNPAAGWLAILFGVLALYVYFAHVRRK